MRPFVIATAFVLFLVGCTGSDRSVGASEAAPETTTTSSADRSRDERTLGDFVPGFFGLDDDPEGRYLQAERAIQDRIAACMAEQGFDYVAYVPSLDRGGFAGSNSEEEAAQRWGFGIATDLLTDLVAEEEKAATAKEAERAKDPNSAIVDVMTPEERQEYDIALNGSGAGPGGPIADQGAASANGSATTEPPTSVGDPPPESAAGSETTASEPLGCRPKAQAEVYNDAAHAAFNEEFGDAFVEMWRDIESDPRITELKEQWSSCMAKHGYEFTDESDIRNFLFRRLVEVGAISDVVTDRDGEIESYRRVDITAGSALETAVREIASEEIAIATESVACWGDRDEVYEQVSKDVEQRFVEENLATLEQFKEDHS